MPRVSILLPNYNYARYLKERLRSILGQTMADFELIYLDDASQDESNQVAEAFASDPRMRLERFTQNSGRVYQRWNDGAAMATGEWLWFAGADDSAHPCFLERLLDKAETHPTAAMIYCRQITIDSAGRILGTTYNNIASVTGHLAQDYFASGPAEAFLLTAGNYVASASSLLLRRDAFEAAGGFDARLWLAADWDLYLTLLRSHDIAYTAEPLTFYRSHRVTVTNSTRSAVKSCEDAYCVTRAYRWLKSDSRCSPEQLAVVRQRIEASIFDMFADPSVTIPDDLRFATDTIYSVVPDPRLRPKDS